MGQVIFEEVEDITPRYAVGDRVQHVADRWFGTVTRLVARKVFGIEKDGGGYYVAQGDSLRQVKLQ